MQIRQEIYTALLGWRSRPCKAHQRARRGAAIWHLVEYHSYSRASGCVDCHPENFLLTIISVARSNIRLSSESKVTSLKLAVISSSGQVHTPLAFQRSLNNLLSVGPQCTFASRMKHTEDRECASTYSTIIDLMLSSRRRSARIVEGSRYIAPIRVIRHL